MQSYDYIPELENTCVALGYFDGLHIGHTAVIKASQSEGLESVVFTFSPKGSGKPEDTLLLFSERDALLEKAGVSAAVRPEFSAFSSLSPEQFVKGVLKEKLGAKRVACGENYRFGKNAAGNSADLARLCSAEGIDCAIVPPVKSDGMTVSASAIREALSGGDIPLASRMLGRPYGYTLRVRDGQHLGRRLGAPTINQHFPPGFFLPRLGVYASTALVDGRLYSAVTNIGIRPTVGAPAPLSETYIQEFSGDLYDRKITVTLLAFLRGERKFDSLDLLKSAIADDAVRSKELFEVNSSL